MAIENFEPRTQPQRARPAASRRSHAIYTTLQREIVLGMLAPRSTLLELELAHRFEVSQGTIREALLLLQEEGLVQRMPHRGTTIEDSRAEDAEELIRIRHDIECRGIRRAIARCGEDLVAPMQRHLDAMVSAAEDGDEYMLSVHDRAFHMELFDEADLPPVRPILVRCLVHAHRYKMLHPQQNRDLVETARRHQVIVDAVRAQDADRAVNALSHHITTIVEFGPSILGAQGAVEGDEA